MFILLFDEKLPETPSVYLKNVVKLINNSIVV